MLGLPLPTAQPLEWTLSAERMPYIERYWKEADPGYCDDDGAESFNMLLARARATLDQLQIATLSLARPSSSHGPTQELNKRAVHDVARFELRPVAHALDRQETPKVGGALRDVRAPELHASSPSRPRFRESSAERAHGSTFCRARFFTVHTEPGTGAPAFMGVSGCERIRSRAQARDKNPPKRNAEGIPA